MEQNSNLSVNKITVSAPGKIHLMGEHSVVHGKPALIAAINKRIFVAVHKSDTFSIHAESNELIEEAVLQVTKKLRLNHKPNIKITVTSRVPLGRHAGSSAAVSVATVGALFYFLKKVWNPIVINEIAYEVEKKQHGNPSGGDNTTVTFGGFIWFRRELEFLKSVWQLPFKIPDRFPKAYLIDTGKPKETTGEMISLVTAFLKNNQDMGRKILDTNESAVKKIASAIKKEDKQMFFEGIKAGQKTLEELGVVSKKVIPFIQSLEKEDMAVKVCGGGGKKDAVGLLLCFSGNKDKLKQMAKKEKYTVSRVLLGEEGVRIETGK